MNNLLKFPQKWESNQLHIIDYKNAIILCKLEKYTIDKKTLKKPDNKKIPFISDTKHENIESQNSIIEFCEHLNVVKERLSKITNGKTQFENWESLKNKYIN